MDIIEISDQYDKASVLYDSLFEESLPIIELDGDLLKNALKNQMTLMIRWEVMTKKFDYLFNEVEVIVDEEYALAFSDAFKDKYREISTTEAREKAKTGTSYKTAKRLQNKIRSHRDECRGLLEVVNSRKYTLNNMTNALVAGVHNTIL
jgi:hypothetical protein